MGHHMASHTIGGHLHGLRGSPVRCCCPAGLLPPVLNNTHTVLPLAGLLLG